MLPSFFSVFSRFLLSSFSIVFNISTSVCDAVASPRLERRALERAVERTERSVGGRLLRAESLGVLYLNGLVLIDAENFDASNSFFFFRSSILSGVVFSICIMASGTRVPVTPIMVRRKPMLPDAVSGRFT